MRGIPKPGQISLPLLGAVSFKSKVGYYYLAFVFTLLIHWGIARLIKSPVGISLMAIRDNETKALMMGLNPLFYKIFVFVLASGLAGMAGGLYVHYLEFAHPDLFSFFVSVDIFLMVMLGGAGTFFGPPFGVFVLEMIREFLHEFVALRLFIYGVLLVVIIIFLPEGILNPLLLLVKRILPVGRVNLGMQELKNSKFQNSNFLNS